MTDQPMQARGLTKHFRIIGALMMRETTTRYGRDGIGFLWVVGEPLMFCLGVLVLWSAIKPAYEHGIRLGPFVMTGYMSLILLRHMVTIAVGAVQANIGLLYHRQIAILHIFLARAITEFIGATCAFAIVYVLLLALGQVGLPHNYLMMYGGWITQGFLGMAFGLFLAGVAMRVEALEKIISLLTYVMIPFSGAFLMASWLPEEYREKYLLVPFPHGVEMLRGGVFGRAVDVYYNLPYAWSWTAGFFFAGLVLVASARDRILTD